MNSTDFYESKDAHTDNEKFLYLREGNNFGSNTIIKMGIKKSGYIINITEFFLAKNYTLNDALNILFSNLLTVDENKKGEDLGMTDNDFFLGLEIINRINEGKNKNTILKLFDFHPKGSISNDYFEIKQPDFDEFLYDIGINDSVYKNKIILVPLNIGLHYGLFLIYNKNIYILDFGLYYVIDDYSSLILKELNDCDNIITDYLCKNRYGRYDSLKIWKIIDKYENFNDIKNDEELNKIIQKSTQNTLFELIKNYKLAVKKLNDIKILKQNPRIDINIFKNKNLEKKIKILNIYSIQGTQTCGYFCLAAFQLITSKQYDFDDIIKMLEDGIFQIYTLKILCKDFLLDDRNIFGVNEDFSNNEYNIYIKNGYTINIRKIINEFRIKIRNSNNYLSLDNKYFIDLISINDMLIDKKYKIV